MKRYKIIDFYAEWCQPCKNFLPTFDSVSVDMGNDIEFEKINVDKESAKATSMGVRQIPTIILFKDDVEHKRLLGNISESEFRNHILSMMN